MMSGSGARRVMVWWREEGNVRELREEGDGVGESGGRRVM